MSKYDCTTEQEFANRLKCTRRAQNNELRLIRSLDELIQFYTGCRIHAFFTALNHVKSFNRGKLHTDNPATRCVKPNISTSYAFSTQK